MYASIGGSHQKDGIACVSINPLCAHMDLQFTGKSQTSKVFGMIFFWENFFGYIGSPILLGGTSTCGDHSHSSFYQKYCGVFPILYIYIEDALGATRCMWLSTRELAACTRSTESWQDRFKRGWAYLKSNITYLIFSVIVWREFLADISVWIWWVQWKLIYWCKARLFLYLGFFGLSKVYESSWASGLQHRFFGFQQLRIGVRRLGLEDHIWNPKGANKELSQNLMGRGKTNGGPTFPPVLWGPCRLPPTVQWSPEGLDRRNMHQLGKPGIISWILFPSWKTDRLGLNRLLVRDSTWL